MSRRAYVILAFVLALAATYAGFQQTLLYKNSPPLRGALWFPVAMLVPPGEVAMVVSALVQYPLFAALFALAIRHWPVGRSVAALALLYAVLAGIAVWIVLR